jgi:hypothetical protein
MLGGGLACNEVRSASSFGRSIPVASRSHMLKFSDHLHRDGMNIHRGHPQRTILQTVFNVQGIEPLLDIVYNI